MESPAFIAAAGAGANPFSDNGGRFFYILWKVDPASNSVNPALPAPFLTKEA
jgi:hypothetical protein